MESKTYLNPQAYLNIAFYRFVELSNLPELKQALKKRAVEMEIRGSILLSPEGINGFLAGEEPNVRAFFAELKNRPQFQVLEAKESFSSHLPFKRMLVKLKKEIITMGMPDIHPALDTGSRLEAKELKKWLDEQRDLVLIDTRNTYEVEQGTFNTAVHYDIETFKQFPAELEKRVDELRDKTVVMFCTGGIRCEKSTALAKKMGIEKVFQLEGGILKYFEEVGSAHYKGDCFVFDGREAVDADLAGTVDRDAQKRIGVIELFGESGSVETEIVRSVLEWKHLPYTFREEKRGRPSEALLKISSQAQTPMLTHNGAPFARFPIIVEYLDEEFEKIPLRSEEPARRARIRYWMDWIRETSQTAIANSDSEGLNREFRYLQTSLERRPFLVSDKVTLADFAVYHYVDYLMRRALFTMKTDQFPKLMKWHQKMAEYTAHRSEKAG